MPPPLASMMGIAMLGEQLILIVNPTHMFVIYQRLLGLYWVEVMHSQTLDLLLVVLKVCELSSRVKLIDDIAIYSCHLYHPKKSFLHHFFS